MTFLIVDDDPTSLKLLRVQLESEGHTVFEAHDGVDALALLERQRVDAVISDILMPRMDGYSLCYEIRKHARLHDLPIIIYSSTYTSPGDQKLALDMGADKYLKKPVSVEIIITALHEIIAQPHAAPRPDALREVEVLKEYNERLVSKLKKKNTELMAAEVKFRTLVEQSIVGIYILQDDRFVYVNPRMLGIFGRSEEEMMSRTLSDFIVPEDQALARENIRKRISGEVPSVHYYARVLHQSGAVLQVEVHGSRTEYNGRPAVMGTLLDITERKRAEEALRESEARYRAVGQSANDAIITIDSAGNIAGWNRGAAIIFGYTEAEINGQPVTLLIPHGYHERHLAGVHRVQSGGESHIIGKVIELKGRRKDTSEFPLELSLATWESPQGWFVTGIIRDITERKQAEATLYESEARYRGLFDANPQPMWVYDLETLAFLQVNDAAVAHYGYQRDEFLAMTIADIRPAEDVTRLLPDFAHVDADTLDEGRVWRHRKKDGSNIDVEITARAIDYGGRRARLVLAQDTTKRRRAEADLLVQSAALNAAADAVLIADCNGTIQWINQAFTTLTGYSAEEAIGRNPRELIRSGVQDQAFYGRLWDTILAGNVWRGEMMNRRKDGSTYPEEQSITPVRDVHGEIAYCIAIKRDLTEEKQLRAEFLQAQKMEGVGQLASGIAHDFNNLLTVINGTAELVLAQVSHDNPLHADVQEILHAGERAALLTRQLLAFSRQQILESRVLNLNTVVAGMDSLLRRVLGEDIDLVVAPTPGSATVKVDPGQIEQVITNLAVNARDAMPRGGRLTIETRRVTTDKDYARQLGITMPPGSYVLLTVSDFGVGMDEATCARIFEPFFTTKGPGQGTGLGLSTVYGIVKQSHGFIQVYSEVGQGTSFKIFLPQVTEAEGTDRPEPTLVSRSGTETILLVEDNVGLRRLATRMLAAAGYTVLGTATGDEALRALARHEAPVPLLLTDVVMPGMGGRELAERLAQTHPEMKVLYMSGYTSDTIVRHGVLEAQVAFLNKPFTQAVLLQKVREVLDS